MLSVAFLLAAQGCGGGGSPAGPRAERPPDRSFLGMVSDGALVADPVSRDRALKRQRDAGVGLIRLTIDWSGVETAPGRYDFGPLDAQVAATARHRIELLPILFAPPLFRSSAPKQGAKRGTYPPARPAEMARFAAVLVRRYGPHGRFWPAHADLPQLPIRRWQVWNEPNLPAYWPPRPDPSAYARLLTATARGIKAADPGAEVISAGVANSRLGVPFDEFVRGMYEAGAGRAIDGFALHPYARDATGVLNAVRHTRALLDELGEDAPIRVTELGWASSGPPSPFTVGEQGQASRIRTALAELTSRRRELGLEGVVYFDWQDAPPYAGGRDFFGLHTGLLRQDGTAKPALSAFAEAAARLGR